MDKIAAHAMDEGVGGAERPNPSGPEANAAPAFPTPRGRAARLLRRLTFGSNETPPSGYERWLVAAYAWFALVAVAGVGALFAGAMHYQLFLAGARLHDPVTVRTWSAPLDDVFIHFDFARSTARGFPFQWIEGNGYSSGGTSLLYPFVLAAGYRMGFEGTRLMLWALVVASTATFGFLLATRHAFRGLPAWCPYLVAPFVLGVGAVSWSLFSGMEVALYLGLWGGAFVLWDNLYRRASTEDVSAHGARATLLGAAGLGACLALLTATRPESAALVALFSLSVALPIRRAWGLPRALGSVALCAAPSVLVLLSHAVANHVFTGDSSAAGALAKLELYHPLLTSADVWAKWREFTLNQVLRMTEYHLSAAPHVGWGVWVLGALPLGFSETRRVALLLWSSAALWTLTVALNGQVVWQNNRYSVPALVWLLIAAALGLALAVQHAIAAWQRGVSTERRAARVGLGVLGVGIALLLAWFQEPRLRDQIWFFGRASRNIHDQHMTTGVLLRTMKSQRVLLGDAGAIPYMGDIPALDIIGLGGYQGMPFARAQRWNVAAAIELVQDIAPADRPDSMALYPGWWGAFPLWFGTPVVGIPVRGNVICGGHTKMVYRPDWSSLTGTNLPSRIEPKHHVVDALDTADLTSEQPRKFRIEGAPGFVEMKMLQHPENPKAELWDAGRILPQGATARFSLHGLRPLQEAVLVLRSSAFVPTTLEISVNGAPLPPFAVRARDEWQELRIPIPREHVQETLEIALRPSQGEYVFYHLWALQR